MRGGAGVNYGGSCNGKLHTGEGPMTLAPSRNLGPRLKLTVFNEPYELPSFCERPYCGQPGEPGGHHIEPRSRTAGPKNWIEIDTFPVRNKIRVCKEHHNALTGGIGGHKAKIVWDGGWAWFDRDSAGNWALAGWINELPDVQSTDS